VANDKIIFGDAQRDDVNLVRQIVLQRLREEPEWSQADSINTYEQFRRYRQRVDFTSDECEKRFLFLSEIVFWELVTMGMIVPGNGSGHDWSFPNFRRTEYGKKVISAGRVIPHDPVGYLSEVRHIAKICGSAVTLRYLEEALHCFNRTCYTASVLLLGVAAEAAFLELCGIIERSAVEPNARSKFEKMERVKEKHRWIVNRYEQLPARVKATQLPDGLDITLTGIYDLIRRQRNELGHPQITSPDIDREHAFASF